MESKKTEIILSGLPPSLWRAYYVRNGGKGRCLTEAAKAWKTGAAIEAQRKIRGKPYNGRLVVEVRFLVKSRGTFDVDNRFKLLLDAMTEAGLWVNDSRIDDLRGIVEVDGSILKPQTYLTVREISK